MSIRVNNSFIHIYKSPRWVQDFLDYIVSLLKYVIIKHDLSINIIIGNNACKYKDTGHNFKNNNKQIQININYEHTLLKDEGKIKAPKSKVVCNNTNYLVYFKNFENLVKSDILLDYSLPNLYNVRTCLHYEYMSKKHLYIAPNLYDHLHIQHKNRNINSLTTFLNVFGKRKAFLKNIKNNNLKHSNINNCFKKTEIQKLYQNTKILINIHRRYEAHSFEELRCLPALQNGAIVVSEKSPLTNLLPYNKLIIWEDYDNIIDKVKEILNNYEKYYKQIFCEKNINVLKNIELANKKSIEVKILNKLNNLE